MPPRPDVSEERKAQIYQAASSCFNRKGYYRTTMDDIADESGLSKGALYWYFKSKKELFISLFQEIMGRFGQLWENIVADPQTDPTQKLLASLAFFRSEFAELAAFWGVMMEAWALIRHDEDVESLIHELYKPYLAIMTQIVEEGVASGQFHVESARPMALVVITLFDGITLALGTGLWQQDWSEVMDAAEVLVLRGLGVEDPSADG